MAKIWADINLDQDHKWSNPVASLLQFCSKVWLQHIKISAQHVIEAQERHEKSPKKRTTPQGRCCSSGGLLICISLGAKWKEYLRCMGEQLSSHLLFNLIFSYSQCSIKVFSSCLEILNRCSGLEMFLTAWTIGKMFVISWLSNSVSLSTFLERKLN